MATVLVHDALPAWTETEDARARGAVFTPTFLAKWTAQLLRESCGVTRPSIADFGCGSGNLLCAAAEQFPSCEPIGIELDGRSAATATTRLGSVARIVTDDFLSPKCLKGQPLADYWVRRLEGQPDAIIMNPPWGADHSLSKAAALSSGLTLAWGQYDTYDLFCELALQVLKPDGAFAFIIPDSIFLPEHQKLRQLLVEQTTITMVARLGEGIFPTVFRGCVVIAGRLRRAPTGHQVECLRVTKAYRDNLGSAESLSACRRKLSHFVPQTRFADDPMHRFDIDVSVNDLPVEKVTSRGDNWTSPLNSRRGVELSKSGQVLICSSCGAARPKPKGVVRDCLQCGAILPDSTHVIISEKPKGEGIWRPFVAGEDVRRYAAGSRRWIRTDLRGISYKRPHRRGVPRILVRKTGIGLNAALDQTDSFTNQVVFEYTLSSEANFDFSYLHYVLGVICSRTLFAVHMKRTGELEWRSHPYVTQKTLAELPIPMPQSGTRQGRQAAAIAEAVEAHLAGKDCDLRIEALVAGLYGLSANDMLWVSNVLHTAADLEAIRALRLPVDLVIVPITVR